MNLRVVSGLRRRVRVMHALVVILIAGQGMMLSPLAASELMGRAVATGEWALQTARAVQRRLPAVPVPVNRTVPRVTRPNYAVEFGPSPTAAQLGAVRLFSEPLVAVGAEASQDDNILLARTLEMYAAAGTRPTRAQLLEDYVKAAPSSPWRASVAANLGSVLWREGYFARAAAYWADAWEGAKSATVPRERAVAEYAIGELMMHHMTFGQVTALEARVKELEGYPVSGPAGTKVESARDGLWILLNEHGKAVFSGPAALNALMDQIGTPNATSRETLKTYAPSHLGTTLRELSALASRVGLRVEARHVARSADIPVPSVVHFRSEHYSTVIERRGESYVLRDPALGGMMIMTEAALQDEMSGFVLVPSKGEEVGRPVSDEEAGQVVGHCAPGTPGPDEPCKENCSPSGPNPSPGPGLGPGGSPPPPPPPPGGGSGNSPPNTGNSPAVGGGSPPTEDEDEAVNAEPPEGVKCPEAAGMPVYRLHLMSATTKLLDRPCTYVPPIGPNVALQLRYASRSTRLPQIPAYGHVGPLWSHDWMSWVEDNNTISGAPYSWENVVVRGDTLEQFNNFSGYTHWRSRATLVKVTHDPPRYERRLPSGVVEVFTLPDRAANVPGRRVFLTEVINARGHAITLTYDASIRLVAVTDALGQVSTLSYLDAADPLRLTRVTDPFGRQVNLTYDAVGNLASITDVVGMTSRFSYAADTFVQSMTTPYGTTAFRRGPDTTTLASFRRLEVVDPGGAVQRVEYHMSGATSGLAPTAPAGVVPTGFSSLNQGLDYYNSFYWDKRAMAQAPGDTSRAVRTHWLIKEAMAYAVAGAINARSVPHGVQHPLSQPVWYRYPDQPNHTTAGSGSKPIEIGRVLDSGATQIWKSAYNTLGHRTLSADPVGRETTFVYAANGIDLLEVRQTTGPGTSVGRGSLSNYTTQHRPQTLTDAAGRATTIAYNSAAQPVTIDNALGETITVAYTGHYPTSVTGDVAGSTTTLTYDGYGRVRTVTDSDGYAVTLDYDALNRVTRQTYPDGTYEEVTYLKLDISTVRDRKGRITSYFYDPSRRLKSIRDPLGRVTSFIWCECGTLESMVDGNGRKTSWEYDNRNRVVREVRADGLTDTHYTYDTAGRLASSTDPNGQTVAWTYGADDLVTQITYLNALTATGSISYAYDPIYRRLTSRTDDAGTTSYTYRSVGTDGALDVASIDGPFATDTITYGYDALGRRTSRTLNAVSVTQAFDALGRPDVLTSPLGSFTPSYVGVTDRLATLTYPNGQTTTYSYLPVAEDLRLQTIHHQAPGGATLSKFDYTYDVVGNILTWRQERQGQTPFRYTFTHDAADQLLTALKTTTDAVPTVLARQAWTYDPGGNRTVAQTDDQVLVASHDALNRLTSRQPGGPLVFSGSVNEPATVMIAGQAAVVDAANGFRGTATTNGGTTTVAVTATDANGNASTQAYEVDIAGQTTAYSYDANGNLTSGGSKTYTWNARNQLVKVQQGGADVAVFSYDGTGRRVTKTAGGVTHTYIYDGPDILEERLSGGDVVRYVHGPDIDNVLARTTNGSNAVYYAADHLGSIVHETDASGAITLHREYDPWGELKQGAASSGYAFTGREWDSETGLSYHRARFYEPSNGRWLSQDPIRFEDGTNFYQFVDNGPTALTDPTGLSGRGRGNDRGRGKRPDSTGNPHKKFSPHPDRPGSIIGKDQFGKDIIKPKTQDFVDWWNDKHPDEPTRMPSQNLCQANPTACAALFMTAAAVVGIAVACTQPALLPLALAIP